MELPQIVLVALGVLLVLIIILIWFYPVFHIFFAKIFFGKFSSRYIDVHKKYTGKSPYGYCIKDDFVNHIAAFHKINNVPVFKSNKEIRFGKTPFGSSFKTVYLSNPRPFCVNAVRLEFFDLKIIGVRSEMFESEMKSYFFFVDNKFVMGEYTFKNPNDNKLREISTIVRKKYLEEKNEESLSFMIQGNNDALLRFENTGFNLSIKYLDKSDEEINFRIQQYWNTSVKKGFEETATDFETELFDKL